MIPARRFTAAATALLPIASACFVVLFSVVAAQAQGRSGSCEDAAELAVLPSPVAPWTGAPLRVIFAAEKPLEGELSLIAPDGQRRGEIARAPRRAALFLVRRGRGAGRRHLAREARARRRTGRMRHDHARDRGERPRAAAAARHGGQPLALAQYLEPRDREPLFRVDREAVRRAARRGAVVAGAARGAAR